MGIDREERMTIERFAQREQRPANYVLESIKSVSLPFSEIGVEDHAPASAVHAGS